MHPAAFFTRVLACATLLVVAALPLRAQRQAENLGRGLIALRTAPSETYVGWRLLGTDPNEIGFNLYRTIGSSPATKVNPTPLTATTDYRDTLTAADFASPISYYVRPVLGGVEQTPSASFTLPANSPPGRQYLALPIDPRPNPASSSNYDVKFCWMGDLDGDGEYDYVFDRQSASGLEEIQFLEAYKRDGTFLWRMNMGPNSVNQYNIEPGSTAISIGDCDNLTVYDMDGDGRAEVIMRTANGVTVTNATGASVATITAPDNVTQYVSVIDGLTGVEKARAPLPNPFREFGPLNSRCVIAYLDGTRPSCVFHGKNREDNGTFHRIFSAFDYRDGVLTLRWVRPEDETHPLGAEGHQLRVADVDNDGRDEIVDIGHVVDDDGSELFVTDLAHGDRYHVGDFNPNWPGLETYAIQQNNPALLATAYYSSDTGAMFKRWYDTQIVDVGRGIAIDIDPSHYGYELYSTQPGIYDATGNRIYGPSVWPPEALWWDGDLSRELIDGAGSGAISPVVNKFNPATGVLDRVLAFYNDNGGVHQGYGGRPAFWGDMMGDWREEVMLVANTYTELRIYTTIVPATNRLYTLMQNPQYRLQATTKGYVQANYVDYYLGTDMMPPPPPPISKAKLVWQGGAGADNSWAPGFPAAWRTGVVSSTRSPFSSGDSVLLDHTGYNLSPILLSGAISPGAVTVYSPKNYTIDGTAGSLVGTMTLTKLGAGTATLVGTHTYNGQTVIWDGSLQIEGELRNSPVTIWGGIWGGPLAGGATGGRLAGTGHIAQPVNVNFRGSITPGAGMGQVGTLYLDGGVTTANAATFAFDLSDDPSGLSRPNDLIVVNGDLNLGGFTTLYISLLNERLSAGTYTLVTYNGSLTGETNLKVAGLNGIPYTLSTSGGAIKLIVTSTRAPETLSWRGGGPWDLLTSAAWSRSGSPDGFNPGDAVTFDASGASSPSVTIAQAVNPLSITVSSDFNYTFSGPGSIIGAASLIKRGAGTLTLTTNHTFTGPVSIEGGVLAVNTLADGGLPSPLGASTSAAGNLVISGGTLRYIGSESAGTNHDITIGSAGATFDTPTAGVGMQLGGVFDGPGKLIKTGPGSITLAHGNNYSGGTEVNGGTIILASPTASRFGLGTGLVILRSGTINMSDSREFGTIVAWNLEIPAGASGRIEADGRSTLAGKLTGSGTLTYFVPFIRTDLEGDWSGFTGRINAVTDADGGDVRLRNPLGLPGADLNLGDKTFTTYNLPLVSDLIVPIGALSGVPGATLQGSVTAGRTVTWSIGSKNIDTVFPGVISNSAGITALTKVGTGTLTLTGDNTYTGATTIAGGTLLINGSSSASPFVVQSGGILGASGSISGSVSFESGSSALLGAGPITIAGSLNLNGTVSVVSLVPRADGTYTALRASNIVGNPSWSYVGPLAAGQHATFAMTPTSVTVTLSNETGRSPAAITWTGAVSDVWDGSATNWKLNLSSAATAFMSGDTAIFDDSLVGSSNLTLHGPLSPTAVVFSNATTPYTLVATNGGISGATTVAKSGQATTTLDGNNTYTGATTISGGALVINGASSSSAFTVQSGGALGGSGTIAAPVTFQAGSRLAATTGGPLKLVGALTLPSTMQVVGANFLPDGTYVILEAATLPGASWTYSGPLYIGQSASVSAAGNRVSVTLSGTLSNRLPGQIRWSGAVSGNWSTAPNDNWKVVADDAPTSFINGDRIIFDDSLTANPTITVANAVSPASVILTPTVTPYRINSSNGGISGPTTLVKNGSGTATLAGANSYTGGTVINAGVLALADDTANGGGLGTGPITLNGGTLRFNNSTGQSNGYVHNFIVPAGASARLESDGRSSVGGTLTGSGTLEFFTSFIRTDMSGDWSAFAGRLLVVTDADGGDFRLVNTTSFPLAELNLGSKVNASYVASISSNITIQLGALSGSAADAVLGGTSTTVRTLTWVIGAKNLDTTYAGRITNSASPAAVTKVGTGTLILTNANTYTGATNVNAGTLAISGSLTNTSTVEVKSGATLNLTGTLTTGTLTIRSGGRLIGGGTINANVVNEGLISVTGTTGFTVTGNLSNAATGTIRATRGATFSQSGGTFTNAGLVDVITAGTVNLPTLSGSTLNPNSIQGTAFTWSPGAPATLKLLVYEGHSYQLQRTLALATGSWENVGNPVEGTGSVFTFTDPTPPNAPQFFYRVVVDP